MGVRWEIRESKWAMVMIQNGGCLGNHPSHNLLPGGYPIIVRLLCYANNLTTFG